jgi:sugar phosphate isomerase/epimerase
MNELRLAGAAWSFVGATLSESANILRALGVEAMELIALPGALLDAHAIARDPPGEAQRVRDLGMDIANLIYFFGTGFADRPLNAADASVRAQNRTTLTRVLEFCHAAHIPSLLLLPGVDQPGLPHAEAVQLAATTLTEWTALAADAGVQLIFEPHVESILESPFDALAFLQQNPTLKIVLDYSHFVAQGYQPADVDPLAAYAGHVHLRQAAPRQLQARWVQGVIDFSAVIGLLKAGGYRGYLSLEYEHDPWMDSDQVDVICETIKMRDLVRPLIGGR